MSENNQILLSESDLTTLSIGIHQVSNSGFSTDYRPSALSLLFKVESKVWTVDQIYDDCFILEMSKAELQDLIKYLSTGYTSHARTTEINLLISRSIRKGTASRA